MELKEQEDKLRTSLSRIDSEISKFKSILNTVESKKEQITKTITKKGLEEIPVVILPHSPDESNLYEELKMHLDDLKQLKNSVKAKLDLVVKEEELIAQLKKEHGEKVDIKVFDDKFNVDYKDIDTEYAFGQLNTGKKLLDQLKNNIKEID